LARLRLAITWCRNCLRRNPAGASAQWINCGGARRWTTPCKSRRDLAAATKKDHSSRPQAGKSIRHERWPGQDSGFRAGQTDSRPSPGTDTSLPTATHGTEVGLVMGTAGIHVAGSRRGGVALDPRSDIFSFGAILYEMLSGQTGPFTGDTAADTMSAILKEDPPD